jgi:hypothetical protein
MPLQAQFPQLVIVTWASHNPANMRDLTLTPQWELAEAALEHADAAREEADETAEELAAARAEAEAARGAARAKAVQLQV